RRRHTRFSRDWSSDVCSSDLDQRTNHQFRELRFYEYSRNIHHILFYILDKTLDCACRTLFYILGENGSHLLQIDNTALNLDRHQTKNLLWHLIFYRTFQNSASWHELLVPLDFLDG